LIAAIVAACITGLVAAWAGWWLMSRRDRWAAISLASACGPVLVILAAAASSVPSPFTHLTQFLGVFGGSVLLPAWGLAAVAAGWRAGEGDRSWIRRIGFALGWVELIVFGGLSLLLLALQDALHETL
jgi:hypothetical protein